MFEIGSPATASGVVSADVNPGPDDEAEYAEEDEDYDVVTPYLAPEDVSTLSFPDKAPRRGDTGIYNVPGVLSPGHEATERPRGHPTERTRSFQLPVEGFPQQHPQVIDVDEVEETGVGKTLGFPDRRAAVGWGAHAGRVRDEVGCGVLGQVGG